ncbi:Hint domain-containing protein [Fusobacterium sp.]|uniref:Hint domain-containing protein n=1 Tax=Fusobacterium sp. TaxID=68766 RepID=UPI0028FE6CC2|nr:Hint domain-containing protein [Fusobacterium sp.]MDU1910482.1 Hint domain-containing protein [Fusobacterium sp.]
MCLEENTKIFMADGSHKPIKEIRIGDMVMSDSGESKIVRNVWQGREEHMMCIELKNGSKVTLTENHPIKTVSGMKKAKEIDENDEILIVYGDKFKIASISCIEYNGRVYNLDISGNFMMAEGIAVGDFEAQNKI